MEFRLLGPMECAAAGTLLALGRPQERCLLAVLLLEQGRVVPVSHLVDLLWDGAPPERARSIVHTHVSRARARLRAAHADQFGVQLHTRGQGYALEAPGDAVDVHRFRQLVEQARGAHEPATVAATLHSALALWRGPALADVATSRVREQLCAGLEELRVAATEDRIEAELALGRHREVITELTGLAARDPLRERTVGLLVLALYRSGQQARALATYREARRALIDELGIEPGAELRRLEQAILTQDPGLDLVASGPVPVRGGTSPAGTATAPARPPAGARPPAWLGPRSHLTSIVGRDHQRAELVKLLRDHRLITIVGPGGVGKTTLALSAAEAVAADRPVAVATLASARGSDDVVLALGALLGVTGANVTEVWEGLDRSLEAPRLLVLDNCEHLARECAAVVRRLLSASARLVVLATSRQPLGLPEETVWRLDPLPVPDTDGRDCADAPAVALFLRRAGESLPGFVPTEEDLADIARICRRVDGLPLALELAAGRLRALPVGQLAEQLEAGFRPLGTGAYRDDARHHTLAATIDWSYRLLGDDEQRLLARLSVFRDGWTADAAAAVCGADPLAPARVPATLASLADRSLVQSYEARNGTRYRLLEVVREYAAEGLHGFGEVTGTGDRHLEHWLSTTRTVSRLPQIDEQLAGFVELAPELGNLRAAIEHGYAQGRIAQAVELTMTLVEFLAANQMHAEQERWLDRCRPHLAECPPALRCLAQGHWALLRFQRDDPLGTLVLARPALDDLAVHHPLTHLDVEISLVRAEQRILDPVALTKAPALYERLRASDDRLLRGHGLVMAVEVLLNWGRYEQARQLCVHDDPAPRDFDPGSRLRYDAVRCQAELGAGDLDGARATAQRLREGLARPGFALLTTPARAVALWALATEPPTSAEGVITGAIHLLDERYPPSISRGYAVTTLLAEARRRAGDLAGALASLTESLEHGRSMTDYSRTTVAVVIAAALAADRGDDAASRSLARRWDELRLAVGLPAPLGFAGTAVRLGLDPAPPPGPDPAYAWDEQPVRQLVDDAYRWCLCAGGG